MASLAWFHGEIWYQTGSATTAHQHEVDHCLEVDTVSKVLMVPSREASTDTMVLVHHARHAVEAEAVELVLLDPEAQIAEQEAEDLVVAVVEEAAVPELVPAAAALVEVLVVGAVELVDAIEDVLARVRVHDVEQDGDTHAMRGINQLLQLLWCAVARAGGEEARNLVAERFRGISWGAYSEWTR